MKKVCKKLLVLATALTVVGSSLALSGCDYSQKALTDGPAIDAEVTSQGGWVVKKGGWIYFINGQAASTSSSTDSDSDSSSSSAVYENKYGEINKGALMRIKESDIAAGKYDTAETVVPLVVTGENYDSGIYIYGDRVYYATPTTAKDLSGSLQGGYVDFKSSSLDGSKTMKGYYFRSASSSSQYRYVEVNGVVYCLHIDGSNLRSYNTKTGEDVLLVKGGSSYTFNQEDQSDPYVYYTMSVTVGADTQAPVSQDYNQLYRVRADAQATLTVSKGEGRYTVTGGEGDAYEKSYGFDADYLEEQDKENDSNDFAANDIETYPYVNLGRLLLDGIGGGNTVTQFNQQDTTPSGDRYTYAITKYENDGIYYTRSAVVNVGTVNGQMYYLGDSALTSSWNAISANSNGTSDLIAKNASDVSATVHFYKEGDTHYYLYSSGSRIYRAEVTAEGETEELCIANDSSVGKFLGTAQDEKYSYVYYTIDGTSASGVYRAVYDSTEFAGKSLDEQQAYYNRLATGKNENSEYAPVGIYYVGHVLSWYAPEIIGNNLYFVSSESIGSVSYDYAHVTSLADSNGKIRTNAEQQVENEKLNKLNTTLAQVSSGMSNANNLIQYYYFTKREPEDLFAAVLKYYEDEGYTSTYKFSQKEQDCYAAYIAGQDYNVDSRTTYKFSEIKEYNTRDYFYHRIGLITEDEQEEIDNAWTVNYLQGVVEEESLETWQWVLIGIAIGVGAIGVICAITIPLVLHFRKKRKIEDAPVEKRKKYNVDMTYDESIDVYDTGVTADSEAESKEEEIEDAIVETVDESEIVDTSAPEAGIEESEDANRTEK